MSTTRTHEGTLRVLPFLALSTAYLILRPFFKPRPGFERSLDPDHWEPNLESTEFPGNEIGKTLQLFPETHPHLRLNETVVSIDHVEPGDQVYCESIVHPMLFCTFPTIVTGHCDVVHAVEAEHIGKGDSSVLYIPAAPLTLNK